MNRKEKFVYRKNYVANKVTSCLETHKDKLIKAQASICMIQLMTTQAFAGGASGNSSNSGVDIFTRVSNLMGTLYTAIAGIASVTAGCVAAVCLYLMFFSKNQQTVDSSIQWLKRIIVCWLAIMLMSTIIYFVVNNMNISDSQSLTGW